MDNASKALIIAGGVLLALLVLTIGVGLVRNLSKTSDSYVTRLNVVEQQKYNSQFEVYAGRTNITAQEIVTVASFARQKEQGTTVYIGTEEVTTKANFEAWKSEFLLSNIAKHIDNGINEEIENLYKCDEKNGIIYDENRKITKIIFVKN